MKNAVSQKKILTMSKYVSHKVIYKYEFIALVKFIQGKGNLTLEDAINWVERHFNEFDDVVIRIKEKEKEEQNGDCKIRSI